MTPEDISRQAALRMRGAFERLAPFIERHTGSVCPECARVCCANKHGTPEAEDTLFFGALGTKAQAAEGPPEALCSLLGPAGCGLPRWQRPFRCTWYFCEPLLGAMMRDRGPLYRGFVEDLGLLVRLRREFLDAAGFTGEGGAAR